MSTSECDPHRAVGFSSAWVEEPSIVDEADNTHTVQLLGTNKSQDLIMSEAPPTTSSSPLPDSPSPSPSNPIPIATLATSHVDQLSPSPPHPAQTFSPTSSSPPSFIPPLLPLDPSTPPQTLTSSPEAPIAVLPRKVHPADLITATNTDPHRSPVGTPSEELDSPYDAPYSPVGTSDANHSLNGGAGSSHRRSEDMGVLVSENGGHVGHGSEEDGTSLEGTVVEQMTRTDSLGRGKVEDRAPRTSGSGRSEMTARSVIQEIPSFQPKNGTAISPEASTSHSRRPSSSTRAPEPFSQGASPESRDGTSSSSRGAGGDRQSERRDKERAREKEVLSTKEKERESTRSKRVLGEWTMGKTLGAGSMGKVKLGVSGITGEKVAIKIIPRFTSTAAAHRPPPSGTTTSANGTPIASSSVARRESQREKERDKPSASFLAKAAAKDASKEVRTMREASLCLLLHHPYVCGMKSMFLYPNFYYMVFEYVNGGQLLDYIISHGRLRERSARKFARQIGSALEYCHSNSIVHRDLKIENILISKTGNIKIIDFGLSNLYSPMSHLSTFCGSLYFAAPELLNAKAYTGPEVDVWSFGIVLYVLVCGKVPFDDQSMPALHAKIKRGQVEYPTWLSAECKHLLSRMLVTTPSQRATLAEIFAHPWMMKGGFTGPPSAHLPPRSPIRLEEVDPLVIKGMVGFEFGTEQEIEANLVEVLNSELYLNAVRAWDSKQAGGVHGGDKVDRPSTRVDGKDMKRSNTKRFSTFGDFGKKLAGGLNAAFAGASGTKGAEDYNSSNGTSGAVLPNGLHPDTLDPTRGFHPLISIYFLVREKMEREQIWGAGVFASSTLSLNGPLLPPAPAQAYRSGTGLVSPTLGEPARAATADSPAASPLIATPRLPMTPQPRQRATGEEFPQKPATAPRPARDGDYQPQPNFGMQKRAPSQIPSSSAPATPSSVARPFASLEPNSNGPAAPRKGVHIRAPSGIDRTENIAPDDIPLTSTSSGSFAKRFGSILRGGPPSPDSTFKGHRSRSSIGGTAHRASNQTAASALPQVTETARITHSGSVSDVPLAGSPTGKAVARASTVNDLSPTRHQRGVSMGGMPTSTSPISLGRAGGATVLERRRQASLVPAGSLSPRFRSAGNASELDETAEDLANVSGDDSRPIQQMVPFIGRTAGPSSGTEHAKPVWLKGLFSVSTTTTKSTATLRADLIKVLDRLGVQYRDVKSGFECAHVPSIDLSSIGNNRTPEEKETLSAKAVLRQKAGKMLLGKDATSETGDSQLSLGERRNGTSSTSIPPTTPPSNSDDSTSAPIKRAITPTDAEFTSSTGEGSTLASDLIVRFEIFIVKMPLLPMLHGLQFRRIGGNAFQYSMLARRVLLELKL